MSRKSSFLCLEEWLTVPFVSTPKDSFHQFLDLVLELAAVPESSDQASVNPDYGY